MGGSAEKDGAITVNWYYALDGEKSGPVDSAELTRLAEQGTVTAATLVWREGMVNWEPYAIAGPVTVATSLAVPPVLTGSDVQCSECGQIFAPDQVIQLGDKPVCAACKPLVMQKLREGIVTPSAAEQTRKQYLNHEASVKSVGSLYQLGAAMLLLLGVALMAGTVSGRLEMAPPILVLAVFFVLGGLQFWMGHSLRKLKPWSRIGAGILSGIGLLGFPLGTLINGYILYLLFCKKGAFVFSADYQRIIAETPHVKYRTSLWSWIALILLVLFVGALAGWFVISQR